MLQCSKRGFDMPRNATRPAATHERPSSFVSLLSGWVQQGLESFFATQRILVDLAMRQNTSAMKTIREGLSESEGKESPMKLLTEVAVEGTANFIEAQRILLDLTQKETEIVMNGVKDRVSDYGTAVAMTNVIRRSIDTFVEMQQNFLTLASKRTQGFMKENGEKEENSLVGFASDAMAELVAAQNKFLDVIAEEANSTGEKKEHTRKSSRADIAMLGRDAADSFIEAQKRLLDLAGQQVHVNMKAASRAMEMKMPIRLLPVADIAGESVKSFVDAEKALVDSMMKSRTHGKEKEAAKTHRGAKKAAARRTTRPAKRAATRRKAVATEEAEV
jgi:hypothetical protein